ncbi:MAG: 3,4-dehydroadipyl-CoA semialdehyde dehydrogenase [bacterium]|nr:3,4-dehydroadipyl-CoA semialdehyde dehydrogenase [bacterium]
MKTLRNYVHGTVHEADSGFVPLVDPCSEETIAQVSSAGVDFRKALEHARTAGHAALNEMTIGQRAELLGAMAKALHEHRDELIALSLRNTGATRKDAKFDIDGGTFTLSHYKSLGESMGARRFFVDGEGVQLGRSARFSGEHLLLPLSGVAVHINAFNFPVWGFAEKAACAILAGMPVITKPATSTAWVAERCMEIIHEAGALPPGVFSMICGSTGDLLDQLGSQDVLAFTGSASTALKLRSKANMLESNTRVNLEADSLNAAVLAADVEPGSETWGVFVNDVAREISQKTGQKCTAVRRIIVPGERLAEVQDALVERLEAIVTGNPEDASVSMGPLATRQQLDDAIEGVKLLRQDADVVLGTGERIDGVGNPAGKGWFFGPTLLRMRDGAEGKAVQSHEVFGPVSTLIPYDGSAEGAACMGAGGGGSLVTSLYTDDGEFLTRFLVSGGSYQGRLYVGSEKVAPMLPGSGVAMPQVLHGGPGRAGGGEELGGERGLSLYLQRVAVTGDRALIQRAAGLKD